MEPKIQKELDKYAQRKSQSLAKTGKAIRRLIQKATLPEELETAIRKAYRELSRRYQVEEADVAVRSSATAEDLPDASFAGQQENLPQRQRRRRNFRSLPPLLRFPCSPIGPSATGWRKGFDHMQVALSIGVQKMVRSDKACAGVTFSIETETGFPDAVLITGSWGLGEGVVQGTVTPDQFMVFKPLLMEGFRPIIEKTCGGKAQKMVYARDGGTATVEMVETTGKEREALVLSDNEVLQLAKWAVLIEQHYGRPMDMEWAKDGKHRGTVHRSGPTRDGAVPADGGHSENLQAEGPSPPGDDFDGVEHWGCDRSR